MITLQKRFGSRIRNIRMREQLTQEKLAERAEINVTYVSDIERGETNITLEMVERIAKAFNVDPKYLFEFTADTDEEETSDFLERIILMLQSAPKSKMRKIERLISLFLEP